MLSDVACYRIIQARDARYDGSFFTGVLSTGIYCRPICAAPTPKPENVRFFSCAAAAEAAGLRPCRRCRPETAPGTPAWNGTTTTVNRALRLIGEGYLDEHPVDELAALLGMGPRHLARLFSVHLGASPIRLALSRRAHFAARLLKETNLGAAEIAFGAGFGSVRQFNSAFQKIFHAAPSQVRRAGAAGADHGEGKRSSALLAGPPEARAAHGASTQTLPMVSLTLAYRPPYPWEQVIGFYRLRAIPGIELVTDAFYRRSIAVEGSRGILEVRPRATNLLELRLTGIEPAHLKRIVDRVRRMFDLDADPIAIGAHLARDPRLAPLVAALPGIRIPGAWSPFEAAMRAVVGQQVSVAGARTALARLAERLGKRLAEPAQGDGIERLFPEPQAIAEADLSWFGAPESRKRSLRETARFFAASGERLLGALPIEEASEELVKLPGVGPWSAHYVALRGLGNPDAFPESDLILRRQLDALGIPKERGERERVFESWRPWRGYAATYLWTGRAQAKGG